MKNTFRKGPSRNARNGGKTFGERPWKKDFADRDARRAELHEAICSSCGRECEVPFKPNGRKPVLCANCFKKEGGFDGRDRRPATSARPSYDRADNRDSVQAQLRIVNAKLDSIMQMLGMDSASDEQRKPRFEKR